MKLKGLSSLSRWVQNPPERIEFLYRQGTRYVPWAQGNSLWSNASASVHGTCDGHSQACSSSGQGEEAFAACSHRSEAPTPLVSRLFLLNLADAWCAAMRCDLEKAPNGRDLCTQYTPLFFAPDNPPCTHVQVCRCVNRRQGSSSPQIGKLGTAFLPERMTPVDHVLLRKRIRRQPPSATPSTAFSHWLQTPLASMLSTRRVLTTSNESRSWL